MNNSRHELDELKNEMRKLQKQVQTVIAESEPLAQRASQVFEKMKEDLQDRVESAIETTKDTRKEVDTYVKDNPWKIALWTLAAGFAAGWLLTRNED